MKDRPSTRAAILTAAVRIMEDVGVKQLTQPKVAAAAGVRQSHLTYYFPKKLNLVAALLQEHIDHAASHSRDPSKSLGAALRTIACDRRRMRFFVGLIVEAQEEPTLKKLVDAHMSHFDAAVATRYGRKAGDADVETFLSALRGLGLRHLVRPGGPRQIEVERLAVRFGLHACKTGKPKPQPRKGKIRS